jgi:methyl-accepting chemotaxis protein
MRDTSSVVADEVRKLADESHRSASDINSMLTRFNKSVDQVLTNVEQSNLITQELAKANPGNCSHAGRAERSRSKLDSNDRGKFKIRNFC